MTAAGRRPGGRRLRRLFGRGRHRRAEWRRGASPIRMIPWSDFRKGLESVFLEEVEGIVPWKRFGPHEGTELPGVGSSPPRQTGLSNAGRVEEHHARDVQADVLEAVSYPTRAVHQVSGPAIKVRVSIVYREPSRQLVNFR